MTGFLEQKVLLIELNEFNPELLIEQSKRLALANVRTLLSMSYSSTSTDDQVEHQGLDPWVQWVNVHTGRPSRQHGVKRLGDTARQRHVETQIWEAIGARGGKWAAWGVMNAPMGKLAGCELFMPDPWSFEEDAYPRRFNDLLALPRYMARNYTESDKLEFVRNFVLFLKSYAPPKHWPVLFKFTSTALKSFRRHGVSIHILTTLLDYLGALEFSRVRKHSNVDFSVIFLNHIAHLQHQFWLNNKDLHNEMELGLKVTDLIIGMLLEAREENEAVILMNGLRQKNVAGKGVHVYRQINPSKAVSSVLGKQRDWGSWSVEQLMTNDAHIRMENVEDADIAQNLLQETSLDSGELIFFTERLSPKDVFCQLNVEHNISKNTIVSNSVATFDFYDVFELVCERTGAHVQDGDVFSEGIALPDNFHNHEIYGLILDHMFPSAAALVAE